MPFTKITSGKNKGKYRSPSGRIWTKDQVDKYYASKKKKKTKGTGMSSRVDDKGERHVTINDPNNLPSSYLRKNIEYQRSRRR